MVETKLLAIFVIAVVVFGVWFLFVVQLDQASEEVVGKYLDGFTEAGSCTLSTFNSECSKQKTEEACLSYNNIRGNEGKCKVCIGEINGARVTTCTFNFCNCGNFYSEFGVEINFVGNKKTYKPGETMEVEGTVSTRLNVEKMGMQVRLSFLDGGKNPITRLGPGETVTVTDRDGNFKWTYKIPETITYTDEPSPRGPAPVSVSGEYHLLAEFGDSATDVERFTIE